MPSREQTRQAIDSDLLLTLAVSWLPTSYK